MSHCRLIAFSSDADGVNLREGSPCRLSSSDISPAAILSYGPAGTGSLLEEAGVVDLKFLAQCDLSQTAPPGEEESPRHVLDDTSSTSACVFLNRCPVTVLPRAPLKFSPCSTGFSANTLLFLSSPTSSSVSPYQSITL